MIKKFYALGLIIIFSLGCQSPKPVTEPDKQSSQMRSAKDSKGNLTRYKELVTSQAQSDPGLFVSHFIIARIEAGLKVEL